MDDTVDTVEEAVEDCSTDVAVVLLRPELADREELPDADETREDTGLVAADEARVVVRVVGPVRVGLIEALPALEVCRDVCGTLEVVRGGDGGAEVGRGPAVVVGLVGVVLGAPLVIVRKPEKVISIGALVMVMRIPFKKASTTVLEGKK